LTAPLIITWRGLQTTPPVMVAGFGIGYVVSRRIRRDIHAVREALSALADDTATQLARAMAA